jgi:hypothetical protein
LADLQQTRAAFEAAYPTKSAVETRAALLAIYDRAETVRRESLAASAWQPGKDNTNCVQAVETMTAIKRLITDHFLPWCDEQIAKNGGTAPESGRLQWVWDSIGLVGSSGRRAARPGHRRGRKTRRKGRERRTRRSADRWLDRGCCSRFKIHQRQIMNPLIPIIGAAAVFYFATRGRASAQPAPLVPDVLPDPAPPSEPDPAPSSPSDPTPGKTPMPAAVAAGLGFSSVYTLQRDWNKIVDLVNQTALGAGLWSALSGSLAKVPPLKKLAVDGDYGPKTRAVAEFALVPNVDFGGLVAAAESAGF